MFAVILLVVSIVALAVAFVSWETVAEARETNTGLRAQVEGLKAKAARQDDPDTFAVPPVTVEWEAGDCEVLRDFLAKETGRKLVQVAGQHALHQAMRECQGDKATPEAAGMEAMLRFIFNLASVQQQQKISQAASDRAANHDTTAGEQDDAAAVESRSF